MLQFVRRIPIRILMQGALSSRRGFLFHLAAGFSPSHGQVDPLSGMSVNLVAVDQWLTELKAELERNVFISPTESLHHSLAEVMAVVRLNLAERAEEEKVQLASLCFEEERGWRCAWNAQQSPEELRLSYSHYLEFLPKEGAFELLRLDLTWCRTLGCEEDFQREGFKLVKALQASTLDDLLLQAASLKGRILASGSCLESVTVCLLAEASTLTW